MEEGPISTVIILSHMSLEEYRSRSGFFSSRSNSVVFPDSGSPSSRMWAIFRLMLCLSTTARTMSLEKLSFLWGLGSDCNIAHTVFWFTKTTTTNQQIQGYKISYPLVMDNICISCFFFVCLLLVFLFVFCVTFFVIFLLLIFHTKNHTHMNSHTHA